MWVMIFFQTVLACLSGFIVGKTHSHFPISPWLVPGVTLVPAIYYRSEVINGLPATVVCIAYIPLICFLYWFEYKFGPLGRKEKRRVAELAAQTEDSS